MRKSLKYLSTAALIAVAATSTANAAAAPASPAEARADTFGDIIVTARKVKETAQSVPVALNVTSGAELRNRSVLNLTEIQRTIPSVRFGDAALNPTGVYLGARGLVVSDTRLTVDPAVGLYVDGVFIPRTIGISATDMYDVGRIEVLKGPQGTLYGKNNTGGAMNIWYNEPTDERGATVRIRAATHNEVSGAAMVNLPLSETAGLRLVGQALYRGGYGRNLFNGEPLGRMSAQSFRGTLKLKPTDAVTITVRGDYLNAHATGLNEPSGPILTGAGLNEVLAELGLANTAANQAIAQAKFASYGGNKDDGTLNVHPFSDTRTWGLSGTLEFALSDTLSLKSITALRDVHDVSAMDLDGSPFQILEFPKHVITDKSFSEELQLTSQLFDNRLTMVVGGYYANETGHELLMQNTNGLLNAANGLSIQEGQVKNTTLAGFAQGTFKVTDRLNFTAGVRFTEDKRQLQSFNRNNVNCNANATLITTLAGKPCAGGVLSAKFNATSWTASVDYRVTPDIMVFARADRGYRTGSLPLTGGRGFNAALSAADNAAAVAATYAVVRPEFAMNYEFGFKSDLFNRKVRLNASYYNVKYTDLQRGTSGTVPGTNPPIVINQTQNVASARVQGVEADVMLRPVEGLELGGAVSYMRARHIRYIAGVPPVDLTFLPLLDAPDWSYSLTAAYTIPVGIAKVRAQVDYTHQDSAYSSISQTVNPLAAGATFATVNTVFALPRAANHSLSGRLSADLANGLNIAVFGKNITNFRYTTWQSNVQSSVGIASVGMLNQPRTFGVELNATF